MTAQANMPQFVAFPRDDFMRMMQEVSEIKLALARATVTPAPEWVSIARASTHNVTTPRTKPRNW